MSRWGDTIKMQLDWIYLAQDRKEMAECCKHGHELSGGGGGKKLGNFWDGGGNKGGFICL